MGPDRALHAPRDRRGSAAHHRPREVVNAILYLLHEGCHWLALPHDFPPPGTVSDYFDRWCRDGTLQRLHDALRDQARIAAERNLSPPPP